MAGPAKNLDVDEAIKSDIDVFHLKVKPKLVTCPYEIFQLLYLESRFCHSLPQIIVRVLNGRNVFLIVKNSNV